MRMTMPFFSLRLKLLPQHKQFIKILHIEYSSKSTANYYGDETMRKKITVLAALTVVFGLFLAVRTSGAQKNKNSLVSVQFQRLLQEHQRFIQTAYTVPGSGKSNVTLANFEQDFFLNTAFLQDANVQGFLNSVGIGIDYY